MSRIVLILATMLACVLCSVAYDVSADISVVPFVAWTSDTSVLNTRKDTRWERHTAVSTVKSAMKDLSKERALMPPPELIIMLTFPQLAAHNMSSLPGQLKSMMHEGVTHSSWVSEYPFVAMEQATMPELVRRSVMESNAHARFDVLRAASCDAGIVSSTVEHSGLLSNGAADVVEIVQDTFQPNDVDCFVRVMNAVKASSQRYAVIVTAHDAHSMRVEFPGADADLIESVLLETAVHLQADAAVGVQYITPTILFGLLMGLFLLFALMCGLSCMMNIQTPLRFAWKPIAVNKEF
jgi:V0 complex accessory subunit Ac45/VOA1 transmembrane domain